MILAQSDVLPTLPNNFWATLEINVVDKNYTTRRSEYYDYQNNRARFDIFSESSSVVHINEYNTVRKRYFGDALFTIDNLFNVLSQFFFASLAVKTRFICIPP